MEQQENIKTIQQDIIEEINKNGILIKKEKINGFLCNDIEITEEAVNNHVVEENEKGRHVSIDLGHVWIKKQEFFLNAVKTLAYKIRSFNPLNHKSILVVGLGNRDITADSLGSKVILKVIITRHLKEYAPSLYADFRMIDVSAITPGVLGRTGIQSSEIIQLIVQQNKPSLVVIIDSLVTNDWTKFATSVQISNTSIIPGNGLGFGRGLLNKDFLGTDVIFIGVPMIMDMAALSYDILRKFNKIEDENLTYDDIKKLIGKNGNSFYVTPNEVDIIVNEFSKIIGYAINQVLYPGITFEEMVRMV